jgi:hypothetical protein
MGSSIICSLQFSKYVDEIKRDGIDRACRIYRRNQACILNFSRKNEGNIPLGRLRLRWEDNIKINLKEIEYEGMNRIQLARDSAYWRALLKRQ